MLLQYPLCSLLTSRWSIVVCLAAALATVDALRPAGCDQAAIQLGDCDHFDKPNQASELTTKYSNNSNIEKKLEDEELMRQKQSEVSDRRASGIITCLLLGFIIFNAAILYMLNNTDPQIQSYSYKMLSGSVVVFNAQAITNVCENGIWWILSLGSVKKSLKMWFGFRKKKVLKKWLVSFVFYPWFFSISLLAFLLRERHDDLFAAVSLVAHVAAFCALEGLGELQEVIGESYMRKLQGTGMGQSAMFSLYLVGPLAAFGAFGVCALISHFWRKHKEKQCASADQEARHADVLSHVPGNFADAPATHREGIAERPSAHALTTPTEGIAEQPSGAHLEDAPTSPSQGQLIGGHLIDASVTTNDSHTDHGHNKSHWKHEAFMVESEAASIFTGFFIKQFFVYLVTGHPPPMDCKDHPQGCAVSVGNMCLLAVVAVGLYSVVVAISIYHTYLSKPSKMLVRLQLLFSMSFSWMLMHLGDMFVLHTVLFHVDDKSIMHSVTAKKLAAAAMMSPLFILVIVVLDKLADHGKLDDDTAEVSIECYALLMGLYWEKVFGNAIHNIATYSKKNFNSALLVIIIELGLILFVLPAWRWYIVPKANRPVPKRKSGMA